MMPVISKLRPVASCRTLLLTGMVILLSRVFALGEGTWVSLGPEGGSINRIAHHPSVPDSYYLATASGVFRSDSRGADWRSVNRGLMVSNVTVLSMAPSDPSRLFAAGTGRTFVSEADSGRIYRSTDGGDSWIGFDLPRPKPVGFTLAYDIRVHPVDAATVYAACNNGVQRSTDGGETWAASSSGLERPQGGFHSVYTLVISEDEPSRLFAGTSEGVFKSTDSGATWTPSSSGMAVPGDLSAPPPVNQLVSDPLNGTSLWARSSSQLWRSTDSGQSWHALDSAPSLLVDLVFCPAVSAALYGASKDTIYRTTDGGLSWEQVGSFPGTTVATISLGSDCQDDIWVGTGDGLLQSTNGGVSWHSRNSGLTAIPVSGIRVDPRNADVVYAGTHWKSLDGGAHWEPLCSNGFPFCKWAQTSLGDAPLGVTLDLQDPHTLYLPIYEGVIKSQDGGLHWIPSGTGLPAQYAPWLSKDPVNSPVLYATGGGLFRSADGGATFQHLAALSPPFGLIYDVAVDWQDPRLLYATTVDGVAVSPDGGATWQLSSQELPPGGLLHSDPTRHGVVYLVSGGVWRSEDAGSSWMELLPDAGFRAFAIDRTSFRNLYAGASPKAKEYPGSGGVLRSTNEGATWAWFNAGLPEAADGYLAVHDIAVGFDNPRVLYAATDQGVFRMDAGPTSRRRRRTGLKLVPARFASPCNPGVSKKGSERVQVGAAVE